MCLGRWAMTTVARDRWRVDKAPINVLLAHLKAERERKTLLGTDESDELARLIAESVLERASAKLGSQASFANLLALL